MEIWVNSATKTEEYTWRTIAGCSPSQPPVHVTSGFDQWKFEDGVPWYGLVFQDGMATLYLGNLETGREEDPRGRPIFVHAVIQTTSSTECRELRESMASLLAREKELLPRWADYLLKVFDGGDGSCRPVAVIPSGPMEFTLAPIGRFAYPCEDAIERKSIANVILSDKFDQPFVVGVTGRSGAGIFDRVCNSDPKWHVAFFSRMCTVKTQLQPKEILDSDFTPALPRQTRRGWKKLAVVVVGLLLVVVLAICRIGCSSRESRTVLPRVPIPETQSTER